MKKKKVFKLVWKVDNKYSLPAILKEKRLALKLSRSKLGRMVGKKPAQIQRYESKLSNQQIPPLQVFTRLCVALQIEPNDLLGLHWTYIDYIPEPGVIYDWSVDEVQSIAEKEFKRMVWHCPKCNQKNYEYDAWSERHLKFVRKEFMCEFCSSLFTKLNIKL
jgi:transcriptional regulator with XRE-family HTH domain